MDDALGVLVVGHDDATRRGGAANHRPRPAGADRRDRLAQLRRLRTELAALREQLAASAVEVRRFAAIEDDRSLTRTETLQLRGVRDEYERLRYEFQRIRDEFVRLQSNGSATTHK